MAEQSHHLDVTDGVSSFGFGNQGHTHKQGWRSLRDRKLQHYNESLASLSGAVTQLTELRPEVATLLGSINTIIMRLCVKISNVTMSAAILDATTKKKRKKITMIFPNRESVGREYPFLR